ncbi:c6 transcription factor [Trichoderma arundinaceum]|uniref:C6 transcription factor n=1 Tax=Trichoderma arundinaceum TaxID=490622 RepID=A0A395NG46_TRIAR|nr:c6 transcription factor [Trichoderma arundinaceum]
MGDGPHALRVRHSRLNACMNRLTPRQTSWNIEADSAGLSGDLLSFSTGRQLQDGIQLDTPNAEDPGSDEAKTDGLAIIFVDEQTPAFYGESSNIVFTRYLLRAISAVSKVKQHGVAVPFKDNGSIKCNSAPFSPQHSPQHSPKMPQLSVSALPPEKEMDTLLSAYFDGYGSQFPFLHEPTFREMYDECKASSFNKVRRTWLGLLNMTFALASNIDQSAEVPAKERFRKSYIFFMRAVSLCNESSMQTVSLDIVQYLLLAVLYLQGTQRSIQTWNVHGILVRTALALGLHSEQSERGLDPIQQEIRRRTWLTIYCLDKLLSVAFGRPPSIPDEYIVVRLPSPWIFTTDMPSHQRDNADISTEFLNATVRLYQIVGRSVSTQYGMNLGLTDQDTDESTAIQAASAMRQELRRWASGLPPHLSLCEAGSESLLKRTDSNRLRVILTLRYHFASILIHRPLLCATLRYLTVKEASVGSGLPYRIQLAMAEAHECIRSAEKTIEIVHRVLSVQKAGYSNLGVWFFTMFYVFNSSLVIIGRSVLVQHGVCIDDEATSSPVHSFLTKAVEALEKLDKDNRLVYNCAKFIRHLSERQGGQGESASTCICLIALEADMTEAHHAAAEQRTQAEYQGLDYEQTFPSFEVPALTGLVDNDPGMAQLFKAQLFNPLFEEFNFNLE